MAKDVHVAVSLPDGTPIGGWTTKESGEHIPDDAIFCTKCGSHDPGKHYGSCPTWNEVIDLINKPAHYLAGSTYESIKVIEAWGLGFCLGNAIKYICRCDRKGTPVQDLEKAVWYLNHELEMRREADNGLKGNAG